MSLQLTLNFRQDGDNATRTGRKWCTDRLSQLWRTRKLLSAGSTTLPAAPAHCIVDGRHLLMLFRNAAARFAAVLVMPQTFARLERFVASSTRVRSRVGMNSFVCSHSRRVYQKNQNQKTLILEDDTVKHSPHTSTALPMVPITVSSSNSIPN